MTIAVGILALLGGAFLWVRQSALVTVRQVSISGLSGPDAQQIRAALVSAARTMTTLDVQLGRLHTAVSPYPVVKGLRVSTDFPHRMRIRVVEQVPVAILDVGGQQTPVSGDGTLLHGVTPGTTLPVITTAVGPGGTHVTGATRDEVRVLAAAPYSVLDRISSASTDALYGVVTQLRNGPKIYFGDASQLGAKWRSALEVLADSHAAGAAYIDVTVPAHPAAGESSGPAAAASSSGGATASTSTETTPSSVGSAPATATATTPSQTTAEATATAPATAPAPDQSTAPVGP